MLAVLYLLLCMIFGISFVLICVPDVRRLLVAASPSRNTTAQIPSALFAVPAGITVGMTVVPMFHYYAMSLMANVIDVPDQCKRLSTLITFAVFGLLTVINSQSILRHRNKRTGKASMIPDYDGKRFTSIFYAVSIVLFTVAATFLMFWTYRIEDGNLLAGYSVFSDLSPHTAMVSSFGVGFNFPTQYMHFPGDGIQYHFFFYYLCGMLEYLGLPIDWAINLPSMISMVCCFTLLGLLTVIISKKRAGFIIAPILVLFRSSLIVFDHIDELKDQGMSLSEALKVIRKSTEWYGTTPYDNWGIWAINVYPNQRHFMLGMSLMLLLIITMLPFIRRMSTALIQATGGKNKLKTFIASPNAWYWRKNDPMSPLRLMILTSVVVIVMPYFHGSALIGVLLVLAAMAVFSESRLVYLCIAICAVTSSFIQTNLFSGGSDNVVNFEHVKGFVSEDKTTSGVIEYLWKVTFMTIVVAAIFAIYLLVLDIIRKKPIYRSLLFLCFLVPLIFAFNWQVSREMLANHKFIQFSLILVDAFTAGALATLFSPSFTKRAAPVNTFKSFSASRREAGSKKAREARAKAEAELKADPESDISTYESDNADSSVTDSKNDNYIIPRNYRIAIRIVAFIVGLALIIPLTATGISEWYTYYNLNKDGYAMVNVDSPLVEWIEENTDEDDVFLTPRWSLNRFVLAGRPLYYGWPYYAWSAGHDTDTRQLIYDWLLTGCDGNIDTFRNYCRERGIKYLVLDPEFYAYTTEDGRYNTIAADFFAANLTQVAYFADDYNTIVYQIY